MINLINESFKRFVKAKGFKWLLLAIAAVPALFLTTQYFLMESVKNANLEVGMDSELLKMKKDLFECISYVIALMPLYIVLGPGMFIVKDFTNHTIRNKIVCGYSRVQIYLSNLIVSSVATIALTIYGTVVSLVVAAIWFDLESIFTTINLYYYFLMLAVMLSYSTITVMVCMLLKKTSGAILAYFFPTLISIFTPLAMYLESETLQKFIKFFIPDSQISFIGSSYHESYALGEIAVEGFEAAAIPLCVLLMIVITSTIGIAKFRRDNIK